MTLTVIFMSKSSRALSRETIAVAAIVADGQTQ
jgi:hypothetical protein